MATNLAPFIRFREIDANGLPLVGGKLYSYQAGTSTPQATYTDSTGGTPNANPVVLDASGRAAVWLDISLSYKFVLKDSSDNTIWTEDGVVGLTTNDSVSTNAIQDGAVTTPKLANNAVTSTKLASDVSVDANRAVTTNHIRNSNVTTSKIADANVTRAKLAVGGVGNKSLTATKTATYPITTSDDLIPVDASSGSFTVTLPDAVGDSGRVYTITRVDQTLANAVTIATTSAQTIDGASTRKLATQYESYAVISNGSNWIIIEHKIPSTMPSFTPTFTGYGTPTNVATVTKRDGSYWIINMTFTLGTTTGTNGTFALPTGLTSATTTLMNVGSWIASYNEAFSGSLLIDSTETTVKFGKQGSGSSGINALSGNSIGSSGQTLSLFARIPITGWES